MPGAIFAGTEVLYRGILQERIPVREPGRNPDPLVKILAPTGGHIVGDGLAKSGGSLPYIQHQIHHVSVEGPYQLSHVWIPLKMEPSHGPGPRKAFVGLNELDPPHKKSERVSPKVALPEVLRKIASLVAEASEPYDFYLRYFQPF